MENNRRSRIEEEKEKDREVRLTVEKPSLENLGCFAQPSSDSDFEYKTINIPCLWGLVIPRIWRFLGIAAYLKTVDGVHCTRNFMCA